MEDVDDDSCALLDELAALLDDELEDDELVDEELGGALDAELGVSAAALPPDEPPPQAVSNKNDKHKMALMSFMANTYCCYEYWDCNWGSPWRIP